jgi:hypothetical protein
LDSDLKFNQGLQNERVIIDSPTSSEQDYRQTQDELITQNHNDNNEQENGARHKSHYEMTQRYKEQPSHVNFVTPAPNLAYDSNDKQQEASQYIF